MIPQSKIESFIEQIANVGSGLLLSILYWQYVLIPLFKEEILTIENTLIITFQFTIISVIRGYAWRRFFNARLHKNIHFVVKKLYRHLNNE